MLVSATGKLIGLSHESARIEGGSATKPDRTHGPKPTDSVKISSAGNSAAESSADLTKEEQSQVQKLQARDREVQAHEKAHQHAAGHLRTVGPTYKYENGPDGQRYAVSGEVRVILGKGQTPEETLRNAEAGLRAALAPAQPSGQDRAVAAKATSMAMEARGEISRKAAEDEDPSASETTNTEKHKITPEASRAKAAYAVPNDVDVGGLFLVA